MDASLNLHHCDSWCSLVLLNKHWTWRGVGIGLFWPMINEQWCAIFIIDCGDRWSRVYLPSKARVPEQLQWAENCEPALYVWHRWELKTYYVKKKKKVINPEHSLEGLMLKMKIQYFGHLMGRASHWKRPWWWERLKAKEKWSSIGQDG